MLLILKIHTQCYGFNAENMAPKIDTLVVVLLWFSKCKAILRWLLVIGYWLLVSECQETMMFIGIYCNTCKVD